MRWEQINWTILERLRANFLSEEPSAHADYWKTNEELETYDFTFARRIGWKWDAVLSESRQRGWQPPSDAIVLDWGCGTGVATRRFLSAWGASHFQSVLLWDRSPLARKFAVEKVRSEASQIPVAEWNGKSLPSGKLVLLLSHVLNELEPKAITELLETVRRADSVLWVEPGTPALSHRLIELRERLKETFHIVAPCPHQEVCGLLTKENQRHWCHHFARPPLAVFQDGDWVRFGKKMHIDLRSLPVSFLVLSSMPLETQAGLARLIGRARNYKGYSQALLCRSEGVREEKIRHRDEPELVKKLEEGGFTVLLYKRDFSESINRQ